jgi:Ca-activated chloride channel homolog
VLRFQHSDAFWLLLIILLLLLLYWANIRNRGRLMSRIGDIPLIDKLMPRYSLRRGHIAFFILLISIISGIVGLANLQAGSRSEKVERKGIDMMIALDVSKSMLASDLSPNRLEKAKQFIYRLMEKSSMNRIGLIVFAGRAYVSVPLTVDLAAIRMNLSTASPDLVPTQGTVIAEAIDMARQSFNVKDAKYKSIILISDGEDHDDQAADVVEKAVSEGIVIHSVGIGSLEGSAIPDRETGKNKVDEEGNDIISKMNEAGLQDIASDGNGIYLRLGNTDVAADAIVSQLERMEQKSFGDTMFTDYNSYFQYFLAFCILCLTIEFFMSKQKRVQWV